MTNPHADGPRRAFDGKRKRISCNERLRFDDSAGDGQQPPEVVVSNGKQRYQTRERQHDRRCGDIDRGLSMVDL
jgi:hypothetical protein